MAEETDKPAQVTHLFNHLEKKAGVPELEAAVDAAERSGDVSAITDADLGVLEAKLRIEQRNPAYRRAQAQESGECLAGWIEKQLRTAEK